MERRFWCIHNVHFQAIGVWWMDGFRWCFGKMEHHQGNVNNNVVVVCSTQAAAGQMQTTPGTVDVEMQAINNQNGDRI